MKKIIAAALLFAVAGTVAAVADTHEDRETVMKHNGGAVKAMNAIAAAPTFDAAAAKAQAQILIDDAAKIPALFAPGTETADTQALPTVWSDAAGFKAANDKLSADAVTAQNATDTAGFAAALKTIQGDCGACHKVYRAKPTPPPAPAQ